MTFMTHRGHWMRGSIATQPRLCPKLVIAASTTWRRLKGTNHLPKIIAGVRFQDGIEVLKVPATNAA
jgi:putative transposase